MPLASITIPLVIGVDSHETARRTGSTILWIAVAFLGIAVLALEPARDLLLAALAPGFSDAERQEASLLLGLTLPAAVPLGASAVITAILNAHDRYFLAAASPVLSSAMVIAAVVFFRREGLTAVAAGSTIGYLLAFALVLLNARRSLTLAPDRHAIASLQLSSAAPYVFTAVMAQATTVVIRSVGSSLEPGTVTAVQLALTVGQIPLMVLGFSIGSALVPSFARALRHNREAFTVSYQHAQRLLGAVLVPAGIMLAVFAAPVIDVLLKRGAFDERAAALTSQSLAIIALGLILYGPVIVGHRALVAATESRAIAVIETTSAVILIATAVLVGPIAHHYGLALAYTIVVPISAFLYARAAQRRLGVSVDATVVKSLARRGGYAIVATLASVAAYEALGTLALPQAVPLAAAFALGLVCYLAMHRTERDSELLVALGALRWTPGNMTR